MTEPVNTSASQDAATRGPSDQQRVVDAEWQAIARARAEQARKPPIAAVSAARWGLALSGGGIRSASFAIGVLQSLVERRIGGQSDSADGRALLERFDYLSTVSGGGYAGAFLRRALEVDASAAKTQQPEDSSGPDPVNRDRLHWLRRHSNFLAPNKSAFSDDVLTLMGRIVGPVLLVHLQFLMLIATLLAVPWVALVILLHQPLPLAEVGFGLACIAGARIGHAILGEPRSTVSPAAMAVWLTLVVAGLTLFLQDLPAWLEPASRQVLLVALLASFGSLAGFHSARNPARNESRAAAWLAPFLAVSAVAAGLRWLAEAWPADEPEFQLAWWLFAPLLISSLLYFGTVWYQVMMGSRLDNALRDYWARALAGCCVATLAWMAAGVLAFATGGLLQLLASAVQAVLVDDPWAGKILAVFAWLAAAASSLWAERRAREGGDGWLSGVLRVAPWVYLIGLLLGVAWLVEQLAIELAGWAGKRSWEQVLAQAAAIAGGMHWSVGLLLAAPLFFWLLLSWTSSANAVSHSAMYADRLERAFLQADRGDRAPLSCAGTGVPLPFPIINTAVNFAPGSALDWQDRRAASFILTPLWCGYLPPDSRSGGRHARDPDAGHGVAGDSVSDPRFRPILDQMSLAQAIAISGAATNPNAGAQNGFALTVLLTLYNIRLGWWVENAQARSWLSPLTGRMQGLLLLRETVSAFGLASPQLHLSDGGHFENLGLYELVRRRCRFILVSDAGCDPARSFEDLGNAIRKCRIDFSAEIAIDLRALAADEAGRSSRGCAVGRIRYEDGSRGTLLYLKPSLTGAEPADVAEYARGHRAFPHESTADQFFDEAQFESYRRLGQWQMYRALERIPAMTHAEDHWSDEEDWLDALGRAWAPPNPAPAAFVEHAASVNRVFERLSAEPELDSLVEEFYPEWSQLRGKPDPAAASVDLSACPEKVFLFCQELLQLMESTYLDLDLDQHHDHPDNAGWMNLFHHWSWSPHMRLTWALSASIFGARFRDFCGRMLGLSETLEPQTPGPWGPELLNAVELKLLESIRKTRPQDRLEAWPLAYAIGGAVREVGSPLVIPVGVVVIEHGRSGCRLVALRIRDHLRRLGHSRRFQRMLVKEGVVCEADALFREYPEGALSTARLQQLAAGFAQWREAAGLPVQAATRQ